MAIKPTLPPVILGGDPFNRFRGLYHQALWWKLHDPDYAMQVMHAAYDAGCRAFDLSDDDNVQPFWRLRVQVEEPIVGFGNPTWEQGVFLHGRFLMLSRDRILRTLVERPLLPPTLAAQVRDHLSKSAVLVFGYDPEAPPLTDEEIGDIVLDEAVFLKRLSGFGGSCRYIFLGGTDADYLISLGRLDIIRRMVDLTRRSGFIPLLLCHYGSYAVPIAEEAGLEVEGYAMPLNRGWGWFERDDCIDLVQAIPKPFVAFMPLASGGLREDVHGALQWLFHTVGVASVLFGTASPEHAAETTRIALELGSHP
ncbi:MAG: hypothetical protein SWK90_08090 [Chloroflexota bacterium]|nr:hypothetical protein [Chloroflexota bacterium]